MSYYTAGRNAALAQLFPFEKEAGIWDTIAPFLGMAGNAGLTTGMLHGGANATFKGLRALHAPQSPQWVQNKFPGLANAVASLPVGHNYETQSMAAGFNAAREGRTINPGLKRVMMTGMGPETTVANEMGEQLGTAMKGKSRWEVRRDLKALRKSLAQAPTVANSPMGKPVIGAVNHILSDVQTPLESTLQGWNLAPVKKGAPATWAQRVVPAALGAGALAVEPHTALHFGINGTREFLASSATGKKFMKDQLERGIIGEPLPKWKQYMYDFGLSPAALDTRRTGDALGAALENREPGAYRLLSQAFGRGRANPRIQNQAYEKAMLRGIDQPAEAVDAFDQLLNDPEMIKRFLGSPRGQRLQKDPKLLQILANSGYAPKIQAAAAKPEALQYAAERGVDLGSLLGALQTHTDTP